MKKIDSICFCFNTLRRIVTFRQVQVEINHVAPSWPSNGCTSGFIAGKTESYCKRLKVNELKEKTGYREKICCSQN